MGCARDERAGVNDAPDWANLLKKSTAYTGVENLQVSDEGDYLLFVEDVIARLGNPKYITGARKEHGFDWYWYVYDNCTIMYELHRDDDYEDRWRVTDF